jgi:hypothetical protein
MRIPTTIMAFLFLSIMTIAQSSDSTINDIKTQYNRIRTHLSSYDTVTTAIADESIEDGYVKLYYDKNKSLKLIEVNWLGESGKRITEYYFDNDKLIFAFDQDFNYNRPIYWDEQKAKEMGDSEVFDLNKTKVIEDRYYFKCEKLIVWLDNDGKSVDLLLGTNSLVGQGLIAHAYKLRDDMKK